MDGRRPSTCWPLKTSAPYWAPPLPRLPAWLTQAYPDTLAVNQDGTRREHGQSLPLLCQLDHLSPTTPAASSRPWLHTLGIIPTSSAGRSITSTAQFATALPAGPGSRNISKTASVNLETLNQKWTTAYWSQTYSAWDQIPIPTAGHNPGLMLAFQQFVTHSYREYQPSSSQTLRPHLREGVWVTHNFMKWYPTYDHYQLSADLDLASWDWYVGSGHNDYTESGAAHDLVRGFKRRNFWLMETQPGNVNWSPVNNQVNKGRKPGHGLACRRAWRRCRPLLAVAFCVERPGAVPRHPGRPIRPAAAVLRRSCPVGHGICPGFYTCWPAQRSRPGSPF